MRMRKKKNGEARLERCAEFLLPKIDTPMTDPAGFIGMSGAPVFLEIGAGKGGFACKMAERYGDSAYFAMERISDCVVLAAEKAMEAKSVERDNLRFIIDTADNLLKIFARGTVDHIFLNFSDPWSKKGYAKRRLTHRRYISLYMNLLKDGGKITFKTDNSGLFDFTLLELYDMKLTPDFVTRDLHNSKRAEGNIMTEYESNFASQGMAINMVEFTKPEGFNPEIPDEFLQESYAKKE